MISTESFSKEWILRRSEELGYNNKQLLEKVIRAFSLLEMLVDAGAPVVFKGGSSLLLILKDTLNRLSIDIDVICPPCPKPSGTGPRPTNCCKHWRRFCPRPQGVDIFVDRGQHLKSRQLCMHLYGHQESRRRSIQVKVR
ncbi:MAG: nucleotidyl transferase AbiEii/AbiGii toxin family protein [Candidatus Cryptobacteroides sp.]|nr:nucleotidyl transferase AbiEii/AbiGii toxin family protein [Candidatus Cryptobacteroides sp.]MEE3430693.1 nucleotidyl transferase AbiEii/AbiGii toxin family protein [Candidatus Cryptobacteroides sp.]